MTERAKTVPSSVRPVDRCGVGTETETATVLRNRPDREVRTRCAPLARARLVPSICLPELCLLKRSWPILSRFTFHPNTRLFRAALSLVIGY